MRVLLAPPAGEEIACDVTPTFSILIPAYQAAPFIGEAIESVLAQTLPAHDIVVCDDGSTDDIVGAIAPYRDRIVFLRQENLGAGAAKAAAARAATGDFIAVLDADDIYLPERLEALAEAATARPDLDILNTDAYVVMDGKILRRAYDETWAFEVHDQRRAILERCFLLGHAAVRRERYLGVGGYDGTLRAVVDWDLWLRMILSGSCAGMIPEPLSHYRVRAGSVSTHRTVVLSSGVRTLGRIAERTDLTPAERTTLRRTLADWRAKLDLAEAQAALIGQRPGVRGRLVRVVFGRGQPAATRLKAAVSAAAPKWAGRALAARERVSSVGAAGIRIEHGPN